MARSSSLVLRPGLATAAILPLWRYNRNAWSGDDPGLRVIALGGNGTDDSEACSELRREGARQKTNTADAGRQAGSHGRVAGWQYATRKLGRGQYRDGRRRQRP